MILPDNVTFVVADTETTDAGDQRRACEIGWVRIDEDFNILEQVEAVVDPEVMISPSASGVHGLTNLMCEGAPTIEEYFSMDHPACRGRPIEGPAVLIGHKISFDRPLLEPFITGGVAQELCTLRWAKRLYPYMDDHKLTTLLYALNLRTPEGPLAMEARARYDGGHRVLGDILVALELARHICERTGLGLRQLAIESAQPFFIDIMPMGKHRGAEMVDVDKGYLRWMLGNMDLDFDLKYSVELVLNKKKNKA
jgi:DNA polymerase III epsilon subunit-like protein